MNCQECNKNYSLVVMIESEIWRKIAPGDGTLCVSCIEERLRKNNLRSTAQLSYVSDVIDANNNSAMNLQTEARYAKTAMDLAVKVSQENVNLKKEIERLKK